MNFKKKLKAFFTLDRHANGGFTLIELIVVIAIMAILAGVGTAGYGAYVTASNKGNDKVLVGNVMRALETAAYSNVADFAVAGQFSDGLQIPVGFVVLSSETVEYGGRSGYIVPVSENEGMHQALVDAMGSNYATDYKLGYEEWEVGAVGGSLLYNAAEGMMTKIDNVANLMTTIDSFSRLTGLQLGSKKYGSGNELIVAVSDSVANTDRESFVNAWMSASSGAYDQQGFGYSNREDYSAVRMAYNNAFAEYVRANYSGTNASGADAETIANSIANYGQKPGEMVTDKLGTGWLANQVGNAVNGLAGDTTFPYTANESAFEDPNYVGYGDEQLEELYAEWLAGPAANDAEMFYDMMTTVSTDGKAYIDANGGYDNADFVQWFSDQANSYAQNMSNVQELVKGKNAVVISVYYQDGLMNFDVYSSEADPRND